MGVRNYEAGEWLVARDLFITCHYSEAQWGSGKLCFFASPIGFGSHEESRSER